MQPALWQKITALRPLWLLSLAALAILIFVATPVHAENNSPDALGDIRYVRPTGADSGNCSVNPCATITYAYAQAQAGNLIKVAAGVYQEPEIVLGKAITITGGYNVQDSGAGWNTSTYTLTPTIVDGNDAHRVFRINNALNITLQNLTIQSGQAGLSPETSHRGGGILIVSSDNIKLIGLEIKDNQASVSSAISAGGGIAILNSGDVLIQRSIIRSNFTPGSGGGIAIIASGTPAAVVIDASVIAQNSANEGGAIATAGISTTGLRFDYVTIADNDRGVADDAIHLNSTSASASGLLFNGTTISGNLIGINSEDTTETGLIGVVMFDAGVTTQYMGNIPDRSVPTDAVLLYVDAAAGDYRPAKGSPVIDIDNPFQKIDLVGNVYLSNNTHDCSPRSLCPFGNLADYGAYEYIFGPEPTIFYIALEGSDPRNNCMNSAKPCRNFGEITARALGGDEVRVAQGVYATQLVFTNPILFIYEAITVTGGYTLTNWITPTLDPALTVLDGELERPVVLVGYDGTGGILQNVTLRNGNPEDDNQVGGGITIDGALKYYFDADVENFTLRNCVVENNQTRSIAGGGGLYAIDPNNLRVENCVFSGNTALWGTGGGLAIWNTAGDATYTLTDLTVYDNHSPRSGPAGAFYGGLGGGLYLQGVGRLERSEIYSNSAAISGGGITIGDNADPTIDRVILRDNQAGVGGGFSIYVTGGATLQNSLLARNAATSTVPLAGITNIDPVWGGNAIHSPYTGDGDHPLRLINLTLANNTGAVPEAIKVEGSSTLRNNQLINVLISGSEVGIRSDGQGQAELQKVLIADDVTTKTSGFGVGDLAGEYLDGAAGFLSVSDFRLQPTAPAVDAGELVLNNDFALGDTARVVGPATDIGAYETTVQKQSQSIEFGDLANRALTASPFTVQATATSGLPVTLTSLTPTVCTISGSTVTLITTGACTLQATQAGDTTYNAAATVTRSFQVGVDTPQVLMHLPALVKK